MTAGVTDQGWQGPSATALRAVAGAYAARVHAAGDQAEQAAAAARALAGAFESAFAATVHPEAVAVDRARLLAAAANVFGQDAPASAALEADYEQMRTRNVTAMAGYHAAASVAAGQVTPWQPLRITVPGAAPGWFANAQAWRDYAAWNLAIGKNRLPGTTPQVVNYPGTAGLVNGLAAPTADASFAIGQRMLHADILSAVAIGQPVVVAGFSEAPSWSTTTRRIWPVCPTRRRRACCPSSSSPTRSADWPPPSCLPASPSRAWGTRWEPIR